MAKLGSLFFKNNTYKLYFDDAVKRMNKLPENSVDMIFADPPYYLSNGGITVKSGRMVTVNKADWDVSKGLAEDYKFHQQWIEAARRILKPDGTLFDATESQYDNLKITQTPKAADTKVYSSLRAKHLANDYDHSRCEKLKI